MNTGDIIAFRATGERRPPRPGEWFVSAHGECMQWNGGPFGPMRDIIVPLTPAKIAAAVPTLVAVAQNADVLRDVRAYVGPDTAFGKAITEILES
jgi:hypothetical protein